VDNNKVLDQLNQLSKRFGKNGIVDMNFMPGYYAIERKTFDQAKKEDWHLSVLLIRSMRFDGILLGCFHCTKLGLC